MLDLLLQQPYICRMLGRRQQGDRQQIHGIDDSRRINAARQCRRRCIDRTPQPWSLRVNALVAPDRVMHIKKLGQGQRRAEIDMHFAKIALQQARRTEQSGQ